LSRDRNHQPDPNLPLLTYNSPQGRYSAQPLLLDFFLSNAPLRWAEPDAIAAVNNSWRIQVTVNDQSFLLDDWQSLYLEGFKPGLNWVKLEFIGANGQPIDNVFNNTVRIVDYQPDQDTPLAALITNAIAPELQGALLDSTYRDRTNPAQSTEVEAQPADVRPAQPAEPVETNGSDEASNAASEEGDTAPTPERQPKPPTPDIAVEATPEAEPGDRSNEIPELQKNDLGAVTTTDQADPHYQAGEEDAELEPPLLLDEQGVPVIAPQAATKPAHPAPEKDATDALPLSAETPQSNSNSQNNNFKSKENEVQPESNPEPIQPASPNDAATESMPERAENSPTIESVEPSSSPVSPTPEPALPLGIRE
ncbi:MAG: hypothetical protein ACPGVO_20875, partial [Spirulinaceae cyanobacterium]